MLQYEFTNSTKTFNPEHMMNMDLSTVRFVGKAILNQGTRPRELLRTMAPHPLAYQELPYDPEYTIYNQRLTPEFLNSITEDEMYWKVRTEGVFRHTGELPIEFSGPDAEKLLNRVFTRNISQVNPNRCSYQIVCYHEGGMINDGVLLRFADNRFWMVQADGDLYTWYKANAKGLNVTVQNPNVWVSQVQGPRSMDVLKAVIDGEMPERFRYFDLAEMSIAGQPVVISRTGFTNELGWELYLLPGTDIPAVGDLILEEGQKFGVVLAGSPAFQARRIEAGLLNAGSDLDETTTPFQAGLGHMVEFDDREFNGKSALENADKRSLTWGMRIAGGVAALGRVIEAAGQIAGKVCSSSWSPYQACGVAIVRMDNPDHGPGTQVQVAGIDDAQLEGILCTLPMYDEKREIPRGYRVDIPTKFTPKIQKLN